MDVTAVRIAEPLPVEVTALIERREAFGLDRRDEVWNGELHMNPAPPPPHQDVAFQLCVLLTPRARAVGLKAYQAVNVGQSRDDYRVPDVTVEEPRTETWSKVGEVRVAIEVLSRQGDEAPQKFDFYHDQQIAEVWLADLAQRSLTMYARRTESAKWEPTSASTVVEATVTLADEIDWPEL